MFDPKAELTQKGTYSQRVHAGKRTYYFDIRASRVNDFYITITETRHQTGSNGEPVFEKHKLYLFKEDFIKFQAALNQAIEMAEQNLPDIDLMEYQRMNSSDSIPSTSQPKDSDK